MGCFHRHFVLLLVSFAALLSGSVHAADPTPKPGPPAERYATEYQELSQSTWQVAFPSLGHYEVLAPSTGRDDKPGAYNCIAHTVRIYNKWLWPGTRVEDFDHLYATYGYRRIARLEYTFTPDTERVVLYGKIFSDGRIECTHGAKQLADGTWTSKLGSGPLIRHSLPESLTGPSYGQPIAVYVRARKRDGTAMKGEGKSKAETKLIRSAGDRGGSNGN